MSDVVYVLLTLAVFIALSLLVGVLDRHSGAAASPAVDRAGNPGDPGDPGSPDDADRLAPEPVRAADRGVR